MQTVAKTLNLQRFQFPPYFCQNLFAYIDLIYVEMMYICPAYA